MRVTGVDATGFTFIHLTDLHLMASEHGEIYGQSPARKLEQVIEYIRSLEITPAFWIITGDLVNAGQVAEYAKLKEALTELERFGVPIFLGIGNHDARGPFRQVILGQAPDNPAQPYYYSTQIGDINVIMLDSQVPNEVHGHLGADQLAWLAAELDKPVSGHLIALHHPPVESTVALLAPWMLTNRAELAAVLAGRENILGILSGHIHFNHVTRFANTYSFTTPAVLYTIDPGVQKNFRGLDGSGFAIGTVCHGQLYMNTVMLPGPANEVIYRQL
ncbi:MAG: metallophosphoesterase [Caldilineaceae bacterium]|nr:metallophosphoesterase [Caldilineaceae bacterium]